MSDVAHTSCLCNFVLISSENRLLLSVLHVTHLFYFSTVFSLCDQQSCGCGLDRTTSA